MGGTPFCFCFEKRRSITINSELIIKKYDSSNLINIKGIEYFVSNNKLDSEIINKTTLSKQVQFINPLPNIVILKHKNI